MTSFALLLLFYKIGHLMYMNVIVSVWLDYGIGSVNVLDESPEKMKSVCNQGCNIISILTFQVGILSIVRFNVI
jgi:hypothetical protein